MAKSDFYQVNEKISVVIITTRQFPSGAASVNRILSYSKGLVDLGTNVKVLSINTGDLTYKTIDGIKYKSFVKKSSIGILNKLNPVISLSKLLYSLTFSKEKFNFAFLASSRLILIYPIFILCKIKGIKLIQEKSEYPFVLKNKSIIGKLYAKFYISTTYKLFDGLIIMTHALNEYFENKVSQNCKRILVPMTVDISRFNSIGEYEDLGDYIAYCGDIGGNKDGVKNLITAFSLIGNRYPNLKLLLIGATKDKRELEQLKQYSKSLNTNNIVFYGRVNRDEIPKLLTNSKLLALARPSSLQSTGGFPTKLGEYLSTGKPVLVTKVGDIPLYLVDGENAFIVEPDNNLEFANKIALILDNYQQALNVASKGKLLTETTFNYKVQAKRINNYLANF